MIGKADLGEDAELGPDPGRVKQRHAGADHAGGVEFLHPSPERRLGHAGAGGKFGERQRGVGLNFPQHRFFLI